MQFLVISDTHGISHKAFDIYKKHSDIDAIIHLGDNTDDANDIAEILGCTMYSVSGNCDFTNAATHLVLETPAGNILLTHGHLENVKSTLLNLLYKAKEMNCIAVLFGHTHIPTLFQEGNIYLINPGSLTRPLDGSEGSYAIVTAEESGIRASILYYDSQNNNTSPKKIQGGYLKNLLNYSDRF